MKVAVVLEGGVAGRSRRGCQRTRDATIDETQLGRRRRKVPSYRIRSFKQRIRAISLAQAICAGAKCSSCGSGALMHRDGDNMTMRAIFGTIGAVQGREWCSVGDQMDISKKLPHQIFPWCSALLIWGWEWQLS